jgi:hypothetical protein
MKKLTVWAMLAMLLVAGSAFAANGKVSANATFATGGPATTNNDDSCDIGVTPAATLLLPYFEVDLDNATGETTLFTITNTSNLDQIAHVTLWTDYSFPVIDFNIYLTGYDVQAINLFDVISRGVIAPTAGTGTLVTPKRGAFSDANTALTLTACDRLPGTLDPAYVERMQDAFTLGSVDDLGILEGCDDVGNVHDNAVGYATIDTADLCSTSLPTDPGYFTSEVRFDNVLIGDYQQVNSANNFAQGNPMVHIRAIPEGGEPGSIATVNFDRTFYSRFQAGGVADRRQPLPSVFGARWIQGGASGFATSYKIWREGDTTNGNRTCGTWDDNVTNVAEIVRFDEAENAVGDVPVSRVSPPITTEFTLPETSRTSVADASIYPQLTNGAVGGWMYLNLDNSTTDAPLASQNWVVVSMRAEGRYSVDFDAAWLANGCTLQEPISEVTTGSEIIGPAVGTAGNFNPDRVGVGGGA